MTPYRLWIGFSVILTCCTLLIAIQREASAQYQCAQYRVVPVTAYQRQNVVAYREVLETNYVTETQTVLKPVWVSEERQRKHKVLKPIVETSYREVTHTELKPITETVMEDLSYYETSYEESTEYRERTHTVQKPIVETHYREERYVVRKPITETVMENQNVTTYKPVTTFQEQIVPTTTVQQQLAYRPGNIRNRLQWLTPGYYPDPITGQLVYRRGLTWVPTQNMGSYQVQNAVVPGYTTRSVAQTQYVPETTVVQRPRTVTRYVDEVQTRRVPYEVHRTEMVTQTEKIPVKVSRPVKRLVTQKVPVTQTRYVENRVVRKIPVETTRYETVEEVEPYTVRYQKWVPEEREVQVPRQIAKKVEYVTTKLVPVVVYRSLPVDIYGRVIYPSSPIIFDAPSNQIIGNAEISRTPIQESNTVDGKATIVDSNPVTDQTSVLKKTLDDESNDESGNDNVETEKKSDAEADKIPELDNSKKNETPGLNGPAKNNENNAEEGRENQQNDVDT